MEQELNATQLADLENRLAVLRRELESLLVNTESGARPVNLKDNQGRLSRMDEMHNQSILVANRNVTKNRLRMVIAAQQRLADNNFGYCVECDEPVSYSRLQAYPEANMCLQCQSEKEQRD